MRKQTENPLATDYDLLIRGGTIVDGSGGVPFVADLAVSNGRIAAIGKLDGGAKEVVDAKGLIVTPGFVDLHTHYDGQAIWSKRMNPSSSHGVTTAIMGNCGVGFAPCRNEDHETLIGVMEGVEDIPGVVMAKGLDWSWETFPEFLDALEVRPHDIDVAAYLPHSPLRVYVMGERGARREAATDGDCARMRTIAREAIQAGAIGFASSRLRNHRTADHQPIPSYDVEVAEIEQIVAGMAEGGGGLIQFVPDYPLPDYRTVLAPLIEVSRRTGQPLTFTLGTGNDPRFTVTDALEMSAEASRQGPRVTPQVFPRPIGLLYGLELTNNPFTLCPSYMKIADRSLTERVALMRDPEMRRRLIAETPQEGHPYIALARNWAWMFPLGEQPDYEPKESDSIAARAAAHNVTPEEEVYEHLLKNEGRGKLLVALANFPGYSLDTVRTMFTHPNAVIALGDGGAHYGMICDASYPTFVLTHWVRDRVGKRIVLEAAIKALTTDPAQVVGLCDRGLLRPGYKADINLIDLAALRLHTPRVVHDLPAGGMRLDQDADGYVATFVAGRCIARNGSPTGISPGRLVRGRQVAPAASA
jgi:N-acyl-D-aspartate/D-glutamate deacylase